MKYFLGTAPGWFKSIMVFFLIVNIPISIINPKLGSCLFIAEFIFTLAMALKCYPLQSSGLLALEILILKLTTPQHVYHEVEQNLEVILLLIFMVAAIFFMKPLLMYIFTKVFIKIRSKIYLSLFFFLISAILSAFLDALTVTAVLISVCVGFYHIYHEFHVSRGIDSSKSLTEDTSQSDSEILEKFRSFLRSLIMHALIGTALGGVCTLVGEPQNLLIAEKMNWEFMEFFMKMAPITIPAVFSGILTMILLEHFKIFGFGVALPNEVRQVIAYYENQEDGKRKSSYFFALKVQAISIILLIVGLAFHIAPVGFIGLALIILQTAFMGIIQEHALGRAFEESLPFTSLLVVFFVIVSMINDQQLFKPIIRYLLQMDHEMQPVMFYIVNGILSSISDNVFVATVYIKEVKSLFDEGQIDRNQLEKIAIAINIGTNLPSVATPNGQAAFLFLLTSSLSPLINLSYWKMVKMAFPYTIVLLLMGFIGIYWFL